MEDGVAVAGVGEQTCPEAEEDERGGEEEEALAAVDKAPTFFCATVDQAGTGRAATGRRRRGDRICDGRMDPHVGRAS